MTSNAPAIDTRDILPLLRALGAVDRDLRNASNRRLRAAAGACSRGLVGELRGAAAGAATPQAALLARTVRTSSDRIPKVLVGGPRRVGHRGTPAGRLVWGSEHGGRTFGPASSGHWIAPTVASYARGPAVATYNAAVLGILQDAGVL